MFRCERAADATHAPCATHAAPPSSRWPWRRAPSALRAPDLGPTGTNPPVITDRFPPALVDALAALDRDALAALVVPPFDDGHVAGISAAGSSWGSAMRSMERTRIREKAEIYRDRILERRDRVLAAAAE